MAHGFHVVSQAGRTVTVNGRLPRRVALYDLTGTGPWTYTPGGGFDSAKIGHFCTIRSPSQGLAPHRIVYSGATITISAKPNMTVTAASRSIVEVFVS